MEDKEILLDKGWYYLVPTKTVECSRELFKVLFKDKNIKANVYTTVEVVLEEGVKFEDELDCNKFVGSIVVDKSCIFYGGPNIIHYPKDSGSVLLLKNVKMSNTAIEDISNYMDGGIGRLTIIEDTKFNETHIKLASRDIMIKDCHFSNVVSYVESALLLYSGIYVNSKFYKTTEYEAIIHDARDKLIYEYVVIVEDSRFQGIFSIFDKDITEKLGIVSNVDRGGNEYVYAMIEDKPIVNDEKVV